MNNVFIVFTIALVATMGVVSVIDVLPEAEAKRSKGNPNTKYGIGTSGIVCGDRLCSEADAPKTVVKTPEKQYPKMTNTCANNAIKTDSGCSSVSITGAKITKSHSDASSGTTIMINSYEDGYITINTALNNVLVLVDGEEWDDVLVTEKQTTIEFFAGTEKIELILE